jgi:transcriptional regulator with XRE-family HTH domain
MTAHDKARQWRESLNLSVAKLAELTGYSTVSIWWFEQGLTPSRTAKHIAGKAKSGKIKATVWQRYRNTCAGVEAQLRAGRQFNWGE